MRRRLGSTITASFRGLSERFTINTDQVKGIPGYRGFAGGGPVNVTVTPKSGTDEFRCWRVVTSTDGRASGRLMARDATVGTVSIEEMESWAGRCGRCIGWVGLPNPGLSGGVKSRDVVQCIDIFGSQTLDRFAVAAIEISSVRI